MLKENVSQYYERAHKVTSSIVDSFQGGLLFVAHASSLDSNIRMMLNRDPPDDREFYSFLDSIPYCSTSIIQEEDSNKWKFVKPLTGISHSANQFHNYKKNFTSLGYSFK